jgi:transposase-like protein
VADDLGFRPDTLFRRKRELQLELAQAFRGNGLLRTTDEENARLRRDLKRVTEERDFLRNRKRTSRRKASEVSLYPRSRGPACYPHDVSGG